MIRGKKYYDENGVQLAVYFGEVMKITQDVNGGYSHKGTKNMDDGGKDSGIDPFFAPYDGNYGWKQSGTAPTGIAFDSSKKVRTANLGIKYVIMFAWHDNNISDIWKDKFVAQGDHFYDEGTAGRATGNHIHFGVTVSDTPYDGSYPLIQNEFGNWEIKNEVNPWDVFFVNDTRILNGMGHKWLTYDTPIKPTVTYSGVWDEEFNGILQKHFNTFFDKKISGQRTLYPNIKGATRGVTGSQLVRVIQKWCGATIDGQLGPETFRKMQVKMGTLADGKIGNPSSLVKAMRKAIAEGTMPK